MKKDNIFIIGLFIVVFILLGLVTVPEIVKENKAHKCSICHKNEKMEGKSYCWSCYMDAYNKVTSWENPQTNKTNSAYENKTLSTYSPSSYSNGKSSTTSNNKTNSSSSSSKKDYSDLEFDPIDYDDPDEYADDAWEVDFDDYDEAYDYWEDY